MSRNLGAHLIPEAQLHKNSEYLFLCICVEGNRADNRISSSYPVSRVPALEGGRRVGEWTKYTYSAYFPSTPPQLALSKKWQAVKVCTATAQRAA